MSEDNAAASSGVPLESAAVAAVAETKKEEESTTKNDTTKNDTTKNDGASESKPASSGRAKRERKTVKAFNPEEFVEEKKEIEVPDGAGVKIEDMRKKFSFLSCGVHKNYTYVMCIFCLCYIVHSVYWWSFAYVVDICIS